MVAAVDRNPLPGYGARGEPQPEAKEVPQHWVQYQAAMRLVAVKVQGHPEKHELYHCESEGRIAPQRKANCTAEQMS
jgi:hypothetical protein